MKATEKIKQILISKEIPLSEDIKTYLDLSKMKKYTNKIRLFTFKFSHATIEAYYLKNYMNYMKDEEMKRIR